MSFVADLKAHLQGAAAVADLVNDRIHPIMIPQGWDIPAVTYTVIFGEPINSLDGFTSALRRVVVQLDCWASTYLRALALAEVVRARMGVAAATFNGVVTEFPTLEDYETDTKRYRVSMTAALFYGEA